MMTFRSLLCAVVFFGSVGCGDKSSGDASATSTSKAPASSSAVAATSASASATAAKSAEEAPREAGTVGDLKAKAIAIMDALKKGDAKAAAAFCLGKHHDAFEKYVAETIEKKNQSRAKFYQAWDGKLGEIRVDEDKARVAFGEENGRIDYLSFRKKDGAWSLDDIPVTPKATWEKWGKVSTE